MSRFVSCLLMIAWSINAMGRVTGAEPDFRDVVFGSASGKELRLDIYLAASDPARAPLIVWVHGGAWRRGSKSSVPIVDMTQRGFSIASVDYRLSPVAPFPAQVHDIKAAIRFLRANGGKFQVSPETLVVAGASAGGHLASLVGVTNDVEELEGQIGGHRNQSSAVQAAVSFYGASNLTTILSQSTPHGLSVRVPALDLLLSGGPEKNRKLALLASPVTHVDPSDPPLWLIHGDQDPQMPINQSHELVGKYEQHELTVDFSVVHGGAHGGKGFYTSEQLDELASSLIKVLAAHTKKK